MGPFRLLSISGASAARDQVGFRAETVRPAASVDRKSRREDIVSPRSLAPPCPEQGEEGRVPVSLRLVARSIVPDMHSMNAIVLLLLLAAADPPAAAKQPPTHEALFLMERVGSPAVSPDGRWVAVPVTEPAYDEKKEVADLWLVPVDGSARPRRLTSTRAAETSP